MPLELLFLYLLNVFKISYFAAQNKDNKINCNWNYFLIIKKFQALWLNLYLLQLLN